MKNLGNFILSYLAVYVFASCAGSKKIDFDTAYKFSIYKYQQSIDQKSKLQDAEDLVASIDTDERPVSTAEISDFEQEMYRKIGLTAAEGANLEFEEVMRKAHKLSWKEKHDIRKTIKKELKQINLNAENANSTMDVQRINQISEMTRWSIIIGSVGLVLLILGAIFTTGILTFFGAIFVVGSAVLFILDQV